MGRVFLVLSVLVAIGTGAVCYWLMGQQRIEDVICVLSMSGLTLWFYAGDVYVNEIFQRDAAKAKYETQLWERDMY